MEPLDLAAELVARLRQAPELGDEEVEADRLLRPAERVRDERAVVVVPPQHLSRRAEQVLAERGVDEPVGPLGDLLRAVDEQQEHRLDQEQELVGDPGPAEPVAGLVPVVPAGVRRLGGEPAQRPAEVLLEAQQHAERVAVAPGVGVGSEQVVEAHRELQGAGRVGGGVVDHRAAALGDAQAWRGAGLAAEAGLLDLV